MAILSGCHQTPNRFTEILLSDDFSSIRRGSYSVEVDAHTEFTWDSEFQRSWRVQQEGDDRQMIQTLKNLPNKHTHPILVAGKPDWKDYSVSVQFTPDLKELQSGVVFRYRNDRC